MSRFVPFAMRTRTHAMYLIANFILTVLLLYKAVHQANAVHLALGGHRHPLICFRCYLTSTLFFFLIAPLIFILLMVWRYLAVPTGFSVVPGSSVPDDVIAQLKSLTSRFLVRKDQLVYRSGIGKVLALFSVSSLYIIGTLGGYMNAALLDERVTEWKLFEVVLTYHANIGVLLFTVFSVIFGIDIELYVLGGRHVREAEMHLVEEKVFKNLRDIVLRFPVRVDLVKASSAHYAVARQSEDGVCIGGVTVAEFEAARNTRFGLRSVGLGRWIPVHAGDITAFDVSSVPKQDLIF